MFDHTSRYYSIETAVVPDPSGGIAYVRRRFPPSGASLPVMVETAVAPGERIDLVTNRVYGDPLLFWRICDANDALDPLEMLREAAADPTRRLRVPLPQA
jgi:hypothetical protein